MVDGTELGAAAPLSVDELEQELGKLVAEVEGYRTRCEHLEDEVKGLIESEEASMRKQLALMRELVDAQKGHINDLRSICTTLTERRRG